MKLKRPTLSETPFSSRRAAFSGEKREPSPQEIRVAAGIEPGRWWNVWVLGKPNPRNLGRRPKFHFGYVEGNERQAVSRAKAKCPKFVGRIELEEKEST